MTDVLQPSSAPDVSNPMRPKPEPAPAENGAASAWPPGLPTHMT